MSRHKFSKSISDFSTLRDAISFIKQQAYDLKIIQTDKNLIQQKSNFTTNKLHKTSRDYSNDYNDETANFEETLPVSKARLRSQSPKDLSETTNRSINNKIFSDRNKQFNYNVRGPEEKQTIMQEEYKAILEELKDLKHRSDQAQQAVLDSRDLVYKRQKQVEKVESFLDESKNQNRILQAQNENLLKKITTLNDENKYLSRQLQRSDEKVSELEEKHRTLSQKNMHEITEHNSFLRSFDILKNKYEELQAKYNTKIVKEKNNKSAEDEYAARLSNMEVQVEGLRGLLEQKDNELYRRKKIIVELEKKIGGESSIQGAVAKALTLIDEKVVDLSIDEAGDDVHTNELFEKIVAQNKKIFNLRETEATAREQYFYREKKVEAILKENEELRGQTERLARDNEELQKEKSQIVEELVKEKENTEMKSSRDFENLTSALSENEKKFEEALESKEDEVFDLLQEKETLKNRINDLEKEGKKLKKKLLVSMEESSLQKRKLGGINSIITTFLKVFLNLLTKFRALRQQKVFLIRYFWEYQTLKQSLIDMQLIRSNPVPDPNKSSKNTNLIIKRFKKATFVVRVAVRLWRSQKGERVDIEDSVEGILGYISNRLQGFACGLFKNQNFVIQKGTVDSIEEALKEFDGLNTNAMVGKIVFNTQIFKNFQQETIPSKRSRSSKDYQVNGLNFGLEIVNNLTQRFDSFNENLQNVENQSKEKEKKYEKKLEKTMKQLEDARREAEIQSKAKEMKHEKKLEKTMKQLEDAKKEAEAQKRNNEENAKEFDQIRDEVLCLMDWIMEKEGDDIVVESSGQRILDLYERVESLGDNIGGVASKRREGSIRKAVKVPEIVDAEDLDEEDLEVKNKDKYKIDTKGVFTIKAKDKIANLRLGLNEACEEITPEFGNLPISGLTGKIIKTSEKRFNTLS